MGCSHTMELVFIYTSFLRQAVKFKVPSSSSPEPPKSVGHPLFPYPLPVDETHRPIKQELWSPTKGTVTPVPSLFVAFPSPLMIHGLG